MTHYMHLRPAPFTAISLGTKTVEMRLFDEKRKALKVGDEIVFTCKELGENLTSIVKNLKVYPSFESLYSDYDKISLGYAQSEEKNPSDMLAYYSKEDILNFGVIAIIIEVKR